MYGFDYLEDVFMHNGVNVERNGVYRNWTLTLDDAENIFMENKPSLFRKVRNDGTECYLGGNIKFSVCLSRNNLRIVGVICIKNEDGGVEGCDLLD